MTADMPDMKIIARVHSDFHGKFGIPRQSGLVDTRAYIVFEPEYRDPEALRYIEGYSHLWIIWLFSLTASAGWSSTVRPPRLGGNRRVGVFASRSPFRPNPIGLSSVRLERVEHDVKYGPVLHIVGADMADGSPVLDIKPYLSYTDSHPDAECGFADAARSRLKVVCPDELMVRLPERLRESLPDILSCDPRPAYVGDESRIFGFEYGGYEIKFRVKEGVLTVEEITERV